MKDLTVTTLTATTPNETFLFYASNLEVMEQFPEVERGKLARTIIEYGCTGKVDCSPKEYILLEDIFKAIDDQKRRYRDGQLVEDYIDKLEQFAPMYCSEVDEKTTKEILKALKKLREKVRKKAVDNLENVIIEIIGADIARVLGLKLRNLEDRLRFAKVSASPEQRVKLQYYYDMFSEGFSYLSSCEEEQRKAEDGKKQETV